MHMYLNFDGCRDVVSGSAASVMRCRSLMPFFKRRSGRSIMESEKMNLLDGISRTAVLHYRPGSDCAV